jgi:hypothetical protein
MRSRFSSTSHILAAGLTLLSLSVTAMAIGPNVIYTEIAAHSSGTVPGAKDAAGNPVATNWLALEDLAVRENGGDWMVKGRTTQATTLDSILVRGSALVGTAFAQDGQPMLGGAIGEQYDFFDSPIPAAWDTAGNFVFGARAKGGVASVFEKMIKVSTLNVHTISVQMGDAALGLIDNPPGNSGNEFFGNSMNGSHLLDDGRVGFVNTPITNLSSTRYPAFFRGNTSFKQSGVSVIGGEIWDNFGLSDVGGTPDAAHWFAEGDTENVNTAIDGILAVDDSIVIQEGSAVAGLGTPVMADIFFTRMVSNGHWFSRGDDPLDNDWAVRNGVVLAKTGDAVPGGESWGAIFSSFTGDTAGNWLLVGSTNNGDLNLDTVMVYNGTNVLMRESDPIDLNNNGLYDDNIFLASFQANDTHLTADGYVNFLATLKDGAGVLLGDAYLRIAAPEPTSLSLLALGAMALLRRRSRR